MCAIKGDNEVTRWEKWISYSNQEYNFDKSITGMRTYGPVKGPFLRISIYDRFHSFVRVDLIKFFS